MRFTWWTYFIAIRRARKDFELKKNVWDIAQHTKHWHYPINNYACVNCLSHRRYIRSFVFASNLKWRKMVNHPRPFWRTRWFEMTAVMIMAMSITPVFVWLYS